MGLNINQNRYVKGVKRRPINNSNKKILITICCIILFLVLVIRSAIIWGEPPSSDDMYLEYFSFVEIDGGYRMTQSFKLFPEYYEGELVIPETFNGSPVLEIASLSSNSSREITRIIGSRNLVSIDNATFASRDRRSMPNLKEVIFPQDGELLEIGHHAFYYSTYLEKVVLPSNFIRFDDGVFEKCYNLKCLVIYNPTPPSIDGDLFNSDATLMNDEQWHTQPSKYFQVFVPDEAVEIYLKSEWGKYVIRPISSLT